VFGLVRLVGFRRLVSLMMGFVFSRGVLLVILVVLVQLAVVLGVQLAGLGRVVGRVGRVAGGHMGVVSGKLSVAGRVVGGRFAVVFRSRLMVVGGVSMVFVRVMRRHGIASLSVEPNVHTNFTICAARSPE
jgi:hypothetical protein